MKNNQANQSKVVPIAQPWLGKQELAYITEAVTSGWISSKGEFIGRFEQGFADYCGTKYGISVANGTVALHLALKALGVGPGDEVIIPALTFVATANAVAYVGAKPVIVDVDPGYWCLDPTLIEKKINKRTKAILAVHLYGHPADMIKINQLAAKHDLFVIEDAAEAHGAKVAGQRVGTLGDIGTFSFYGNKIITTGEGGMVVINNPALAKKISMLKNHGMDPNRKYWHPVVGYNYRMTNLQAAIGLAQLEKIDRILTLKKNIRQQYDQRLKHVKGIELQPEQPWAESVCWLYSLLIKNRATRDRLIAVLHKNNIESRPFFFSLEALPPYYKKRKCKIADDLSARGINLPSATDLSVEDINRISNIVRETVKRG